MIEMQGLPGAQGSKTQTRWGGLKESSAKVAVAGLLWRMPANSNGKASRSPIRWRCRSPSCCPGRSITGAKPRAKRISCCRPHRCIAPAPATATSTSWPAPPSTGARSAAGCLIADDSQVVSLALAKRYAERLEPTGAVVRLRIAP